MDLSVNTLVEHAAAYSRERATRALRFAAGTAPNWSRAELFAQFPEFTRVETFIALKELIESPRTDDAKRGRLKLLQTFVARSIAEGAGAAATDSAEAALHSGKLAAAGRTFTLAEALSETPRQSSREAREALEQAAAAALWAEQAHWARRADAVIHAAALLGFGSAEAFAGALRGRELPALFDGAQALLTSTADAYRDLFGFALKRLDAQLKPGAVKLHDLERVLLGPWLFELFRKEDLEHALTRTLGDLGLHPSAHGKIAIDTGARPRCTFTALRFDVEVPDDVRLLLQPSMGFDTYAGWLSTWGAAHHRAAVNRTLPFVERALGDGAVVGAVERLFESFLLDEKWLQRYLRLSGPQAREAARLFAFRQLAQLRRLAATALASRELAQRGPVRPVVDDYVAALSTHLLVEAPAGRAFFETDVLLSEGTLLDAWALETAYSAHLRERFNEDFWRNPATGRWLLELASRGQRDDAATLAKAYGGATLDVGPAGRRRVDVMGA